MLTVMPNPVVTDMNVVCGCFARDARFAVHSVNGQIVAAANCDIAPDRL